MNVYAPNSGQLNFLTETFDLQHFSRPFTVVGGDFNAILSSTRDRRSLFQTKLPLPMQSLASSFCQLAWAHHQFDAWRIKHPTSRQFSFYPPPHKVFSRLDYFCVTAPLLPNTVASHLGPITWSDHAPLTLDLSLSTAFFKTCHWRLNESLLNHPVTKGKLLSALTKYFQLNAGSVSSPSALWESHKAFFRGQCISVSSCKKDTAFLKSTLLAKLQAAERFLPRWPD